MLNYVSVGHENQRRLAQQGGGVCWPALVELGAKDLGPGVLSALLSRPKE